MYGLLRGVKVLAFRFLPPPHVSPSPPLCCCTDGMDGFSTWDGPNGFKSNWTDLFKQWYGEGREMYNSLTLIGESGSKLCDPSAP